MKTEYINKGVCSRKTVVDLDENGIIREIELVGGCHGNTQGLAKLLVGMDAREAVNRMKGIDCGGRGTSCPDQVAKALEEALKK